MDLFTADLSANDLWTRYRVLSPGLKGIVRLKALVYPTVTPHLFPQIVKAAHVATAAGRGWSQQTLEEGLKELVDIGLLKRNRACADALLHRVTVDALASDDAGALMSAVRNVFSKAAIEYRYLSYGSIDTKVEGLVRDVRLAIYTNDEIAFRAEWSLAAAAVGGEQFQATMAAIIGESNPSAEWISSRRAPMQALLLSGRLAAFADRNDFDSGLASLVATCRGRLGQPGFEALRPQIMRLDLLSGAFDRLRAALAIQDAIPVDERIAFEAAIDFLEGRNSEAIVRYREALKQRRKRIGKRKIFLGKEHRMLFPLALLKAGDTALHAELQTALEVAASENGTGWNAVPEPGLDALTQLLWLAQGQEVRAREEAGRLATVRAVSPLVEACIALALHATDPELSAEHLPVLRDRFAGLREAAPLLAGIYAEILAASDPNPEPYRAWLRDTPRRAKIEFTRIIGSDQPWERVLESLDTLLGASERQADKPEQKSKRLVFFLDPARKEVTIAEQSAKARGGWTDGRPVALKRLHERDPKLDYLTPEDHAVLKAVRRESRYYGPDEYEIDPERAIVALVGHPAVFHAHQRGQALELVPYPVELLITETKTGYHIALSHSSEHSTVFLEEDTPTRYRVIEFSKSLLPLQELLGSDGIAVPAEGRERVLTVVKRNNPTLPIRAEIAEVASGVDGQPAPVVQIVPAGEGLLVTLLVRPFGADGPAYVAGLGGRSVLATVNGVQTRATRDLPREIEERQTLIDACPTLRDRIGTDSHEVAIDDLDGSLELLLELRAYTGPAFIEWPEGKRIRVVPVDHGKMKVKVSQERDWFGIAGSVDLDDDQVVEMRFLLDRLSQARGRFVQLEDGQFIALTRQLQQQLERLAAVSEPYRNGRRVHALGAPALDAVLDGAGEVKTDAAWKKHVAAIRSAEGHTPRVPATLQAELRDYQVDGFIWMSRLARWGAGACLADDMGLGKTVQAIAVLLDRANEGPALVVAPTSVCPNWASELARFAPTLTVHRLNGGDRAAKIASLGPRDVLVTSYGLLNQSAEELAARDWNMIVLDEAQAIKNAETKRAQSVSGLRAGFRLALTGTPVENYLDELWSLFSFVVPGVLGSRDGFQKRFARAIERDRDPHARQALRALIRPFLLRRTKAAVLSELPPRTEQTMHVEMEDAEKSFYEALRQQSLERIDAMDGLPGQRRVRILAEIMKLRRACCNPALIDAKAAVPSGKLAAFMELVDELVKNRHRALVFSQFVGHLDLIRAALDRQGLRYEYLDGSTPMAEREKRVAAFQGGSAELFLISLKAGGTGLNLTAADYVVHLDPWWNPAVEDQASDRAHRIGQERPVTIYRLIMQDSIEERILALHRDKRDLASDILEGGEVSARLSEEDLLGLIRG